MMIFKMLSSLVQRVRIWPCHCRGSGCCCDTGFIHGLGTAIRHGCGQKKKVERNKSCQLRTLYLVKLFFINGEKKIS